MAIVTITHITAQASYAELEETVTTLPKGGILLSINATWIGTELIDQNLAGTVEEAYKPGSLFFGVFTGNAGNTRSLISIDPADLHIIQQGSSFAYEHPEATSLRNCDFSHFLRPRPVAEGGAQGVVQQTEQIKVITQVDPEGYPANFTAGRHRAQYDLEILTFE